MLMLYFTLFHLRLHSQSQPVSVSERVSAASAAAARADNNCDIVEHSHIVIEKIGQVDNTNYSCLGNE